MAPTRRTPWRADDANRMPVGGLSSAPACFHATAPAAGSVSNPVISLHAVPPPHDRSLLSDAASRGALARSQRPRISMLRLMIRRRRRQRPLSARSMYFNHSEILRLERRSNAPATCVKRTDWQLYVHISIKSSSSIFNELHCTPHARSGRSPDAHGRFRALTFELRFISSDTSRIARWFLANAPQNERRLGRS